MTWQRIAPEDAVKLLAEKSPAVVDVRDGHSWQTARIPGAIHLDNHSASEFVENTDKQRPVLVYCYHGHSSQSAAAWLSARGFAEVYSLDGGFAIWSLTQATES